MPRETKNSNKMAQFTPKQFNQILYTLGASSSKKGSSATSTARFNGSQNIQKVEAFITTVTIFKEMEKITDKEALRGLPILLEEKPFNWWEGVKGNAGTWAEAVKLIREKFSPPKPAWRIFGEIAKEHQQSNELTDDFITRKRALFAQLKNQRPIVESEIDMCYYQLLPNLREKIPRADIKSFEDLLRLAIIVESHE